MKISVLGSGRWGTFLAWYSKKIGHDVMLWGRENSKAFNMLKSERHNEYLKLQEDLILSSSLEEALSFGKFIIIAISAQELRALAKLICKFPMENRIFILCMKGIEAGSGKRLSQIVYEEMGANTGVAIWVGPGHVQDYVRGIPNCMVVGSNNIDVTKSVVNELGSEIIRFYYGQDLIGNEIGAASKNVIGIGAGMLDGLNYSSLKGALMARGTREISRLIKAMGGNELTAYGLSHLGDYEATLFSQHSHNRRFGEEFVKGSKFEKLAEGVATSKALKMLSDKHDVDLPICNSIYSILYEGKDPKQELVNMFLRPVKYEF